METGLRALLTTNGVDAQVIAWLGSETQMCRAMKVFANWVGSKAQLQAAVLEHIADFRTSRAQLDALKQMHVLCMSNFKGGGCKLLKADDVRAEK